MKNVKDTVMEDFEKLMGIDKLPHDTCQCCNKVYDGTEYELYGYDKPSMCKQCQVDNAIADIIVSNCTR